jgi:hypothetical protein
MLRDYVRERLPLACNSVRLGDVSDLIDTLATARVKEFPPTFGRKSQLLPYASSPRASVFLGRSEDMARSGFLAHVTQKA